MNPTLHQAARILSEPICFKGPVVNGFARGSKLLGFPTANLPMDTVGDIVDKMDTGVYYGYASVGDSSAVYKTVMSVGWNPVFKNEHKSVEPYLIHEFKEDFYGEELRVVCVGYLRNEMNFDGLEPLIDAIKSDVAATEHNLSAVEELHQHESHPFLKPGQAS